MKKTCLLVEGWRIKDLNIRDPTAVLVLFMEEKKEDEMEEPFPPLFPPPPLIPLMSSKCLTVEEFIIILPNTSLHKELSISKRRDFSQN